MTNAGVSREEVLKNVTEKALPILLKSGNCAQTSFLVLKEQFNLDDGKILKVNKSHVQFTSDFLQQIYDKPLCGYDEYSRLDKSRYMINNRDNLIEMLKGNSDGIDQLLDIDKINNGDIQDIFNIDSKKELRDAVNILINGRAIKRISNGFIKTPAYIQFLRELKLNGSLKREDVPAEVAPDKRYEKDNEFDFDKPPF